MVWSINVYDETNDCKNLVNLAFYEAPLAKAMEITKQYPEHTVIVSYAARNRMRLLNGEIIWQETCLGEFYLEEESQDWLIGAIVYGEMLEHEEFMSYDKPVIPKHWDIPVEVLLARYRKVSDNG